jgi:hypothetical protein
MIKYPLIAASALAVGIGLAAPAHADPVTDVQFVQFLDKKGIPYDSPSRAVTEAKAVCLMLQQGDTFTETARGLAGVQTNYSVETAAFFAGAATAAYCPAYQPTGS